MSSSSAIADSGRFSGQKMTFSKTCNLLSQYVKEKRAAVISGVIDGRGFATDGRNFPTMNLFPVNGKPTEGSNGCIGQTVNLFPQQASLKANSCNEIKEASPEPQAAPMTIFYGGQVIVFNNLTMDKANEVMDLASSFESSLKKRKLETTNLPPLSPITIPTLNPNSNPNTSMNLNPSQDLNVAPNFGINVTPANVPVPPVANVSDIPIVRKASLHRFLEKRKDRLVGKAIDVSSGSSSKPIESKSWLGLGSLPVFQPQQL